MEYIVGDEVEVRGDDEVFKFSYYGARVSATHAEGIEVVYHNRKALSGEDLIEIVGNDRVRRIPDTVIGDFQHRDFVEVWKWGGWWQGVVLGGDAINAIVYFRYRENVDQHHIIPKGQIRIQQQWYDVFKNGDEVEVLGVHGIYTHSLFGASVLNMQGENVVVEYNNRTNPTQVRYVPDLVVGEIVFNDFVEAWIDGAWWGGYALGVDNRRNKGRHVSDVGKKNCYCILYSTEEEETSLFEEEDAHQLIGITQKENNGTFSKVFRDLI
ncbi:hypothetical protein LXL04_028368 [Taraxacum kok-saghyz]